MVGRGAKQGIGACGEYIRNLRFWYSVIRFVPLRGKGPLMSADNEHSDDGGVETRDDGGAIATSSERLVDLYREMALIRAFEEACQRGFRQGKIGGYLHVYIGQEAVATGFCRPSRRATGSSRPTATTRTRYCWAAIPKRSWPSSTARRRAW